MTPDTKFKKGAQMPTNILTNLEINNAEDYAYDHQFWVVRLCNTELWFYGAYDDADRAQTAAEEIGNGFVIDTRLE